jgi:hypothetical protein
MIRRSVWVALIPLSASVLGVLCADAHAGPFDADRARIAKARAQADVVLAQTEAQCMQRFAVNSCLDEARRLHRETVEPLRQESMILDERERKQRAADRLDQLRVKSLAAQARAASSASAASSQPASPPGEASAPEMPGVRPKLRGGPSSIEINPAADAASSSSSSALPRDVVGEASVAPSSPVPAKQPRSPTKRLTPAPDPAATAAAERKAAEARTRREKVERRNAERDAKKPPAKGLPVPDAASTASASGR